MKRLSILTIIGIIVSTLVISSPAEATIYGGKFYRSGSFTLYFSYGGSHRYYGNVWQGAANWSATSTNVNISPWPGTPYAIHIDVYDTYNTSVGWWGMTYFDPCSGALCHYVRNYYYLNQKTLDPESDFTRNKVATHEFGHTIGLAHTSPSGINSIMYQGRLSYNKPKAYDIHELNWYLY